ncbi:phage tail protein [Cryptosporangium minutisporangium]|uniref:phage tail protein n=1 Tax=Cryptosporangium minutisporangium TaxID=113569 RepID=UPI0031E67BA8
MPTEPALTPWYPLRTHQFRIGILPPPPDPTGGRSFLGAPVGTSPATPPQPAPEGQSYVAGVKRVSGLNVSIAATETKEGGNSLHRYANPDRATWDPITLEQGLAVDDTLERWAAAVLRFLRTGAVEPGEPVKRNVVIDVWDTRLHGADLSEGLVGSADDGGRPPDQRLRRYIVVNAWISKFRAVPQLDALSSEVALLAVELTHEGWHADQPSGGAPAIATPVTI